MFVVILGMIVAVALALVIVSLVAIPAVQDGEQWLTQESHERMSDLRARAGDTLGAARDKVTATR